jgi:hypothetical protein
MSSNCNVDDTCIKIVHSSKEEEEEEEEEEDNFNIFTVAGSEKISS